MDYKVIILARYLSRVCRGSRISFRCSEKVEDFLSEGSEFDARLGHLIPYRSGRRQYICDSILPFSTDIDTVCLHIFMMKSGSFLHDNP